MSELSNLKLLEISLKRPLSSSPQFFIGFMLSLSLFCFGIASFLAWLGATWVIVFALIDIAALCAAVIWYVRHALDVETVTLTHDNLTVERHIAGRVEKWSMERFYVRLQIIHVKSGPFVSPRLRISARLQNVVLGSFCHSAQLLRCEKLLRGELNKR